VILFEYLAIENAENIVTALITDALPPVKNAKAQSKETTKTP